MKLTKQAISKLMDPVNRTVRIVNDAYREITATAKFNNYKIEIRVAVVHPLLQDKVTLFRGERVTMIYWVARTGDKVDEIPESLAPVIEDMRNAATMDRQEALNLCIGMKKFFDQQIPKTDSVATQPTEVVPSNVVEMKQPEAAPMVPAVAAAPVKQKRQYKRKDQQIAASAIPDVKSGIIVPQKPDSDGIMRPRDTKTGRYLARQLTERH